MVGLLTIGKHNMHQREGVTYHVLLDGVDVTQSCFVADDRYGYVGMYPRDENGRIRYDRQRQRPVAEIRIGDVRIVEGEPFGTKR